MSVTVSLSTLIVYLAAGFHLHLSLDLALTCLVQAKYNEFFSLSYMGVVKSTYEFQLNLSQAIQMFLHRDQFLRVQIYTYAEAENTKDFRKELINYFLFWKMKKSGV